MTQSSDRLFLETLDAVNRLPREHVSRLKRYLDGLAGCPGHTAATPHAAGNVVAFPSRRSRDNEGPDAA